MSDAGLERPTTAGRMAERAFAWLGRIAGLAALAGAAVTLRRVGPAQVPAAPSPVARPAASDGARPAQVDRVDLLIDRLDEARFHVPKLTEGLQEFRANHWRAMGAPHARVSGEARKAVQFVAFTVGGPEKKLDDAHGNGLGSAAGLRTWNSAEASFDGREAIFAPPPSEISFPLRVPEGARLEVAPAVVAIKAIVTFEVAVRPKGGERKVLDSVRLRASEEPAWKNRTIDLGAYAGQDVEIELVTRGGSTEDPSCALWGAPAIVARGPAGMPYNVLWIVIDTMRPDALVAYHDAERDELLARAPLAPLQAWLPAMPTVAPAIDAVARRGVTFVDAVSAATWTRPGTLSMLAGARSSQLGLDTTLWVLPQASIQRFYAAHPPLLPVLLRQQAVRPQAFVNNFFLSGYARAGVDVGFSGLVDHRHEILDTERIARDTLAWLDHHAAERFFLFVNMNSPHGAYSPPDQARRQVPKPPLGPKDEPVRLYLGEIAKDDDAVGKIVAKVDALGLAESTLIIVTADHGETLSEAHSILVEGLGEQTGSTRYHHASAMYDETTRIPLIMALPGRLSAGGRPRTPVQNTDILPTILELEGLMKPPKVRGESLVKWATGGAADLDRPVVSEGRGARSIRVGRWRYVERDAGMQKIRYADEPPRTIPEELYDLVEDPGERRSVAREHRDVVNRLRDQLGEALAGSTAADAQRSASLAGSRHVPKDDSPPAHLHLRFSGAGSQAVHLVIHTADPEPGAPMPRLTATAHDIDPDSLRGDGRSLDASFYTLIDDAVGLDLEVSPASTPLTWEIQLGERPLDGAHVYGGPFGLAAPALVRGLLDAEARLAATSAQLPLIDPRHDLGLFVVRDPAGDVGLTDPGAGGEALGEVKQLLEMWGYAASSDKKAR
jgi:arylsulfatase A-like enzyme